MGIILFFSFLLIGALVLAMVREPIMAAWRARRGVQNHDALWQKQLFRLPMDADRAEDLLKAENVWDNPRSHYDRGNLTFTYQGAELHCRVSFLTDGKDTYLLLKAVSAHKGGIAYMMADYFRKKLDAEPAEIALLPQLREIERVLSGEVYDNG